MTNPYKSPQEDEPIIRAEVVPEKRQSSTASFVVTSIVVLIAGYFALLALSKAGVGIGPWETIIAFLLWAAAFAIGLSRR